MKKNCLILLALIVFTVKLFGQNNTPAFTCATANPICAGNGFSFPNVALPSVVTAEAGINYGCLGSQPRPNWFYFKIGTTGLLSFQIAQGTTVGQTNLDADYICWGPFTTPTCGAIGLNGHIAQQTNGTNACSFSIDTIENFTLNAVSGQYYMLMITNYDGGSGFITINQTNHSTAGAGSVYCDIVCTTPAPIGSTTQSLCSGSTVTNLNSTGTNIKWYATRTGGTALASTTALVNGTTYYASQTVNGCESTARMSVVVTLNNPTVSASITLTYGNDYQVINEMCPIQEITYTLSGGATGVTVVGLPYGVNVSTVGTTVTISSSFMHIPIGYYNFTITTTGGCGTSSVNGYIIVIPNSPPPTLSSSIGTDNQTVCLGASIQNISYTINSGNVSVYNLPPGVNYTLNGQEIIITGTPNQAGVYNYNIFDPGNGNGCLFIPTQGTITVNPIPSAPIIGDITQPTCVTPTGNVVLTGLPSGNWTINPRGITGSTTTATLSGLPAGAYNYTVTNASGCISSASANVIINPTVTASITHTSGNEYQVINQMCQIQEITYTLSGGATGVTVVGLPYGVNVSTVGTTVTISSSFMHIPIGYYNFTITTTGGCGTSSVNGYITVIPNSPPPTLSSSIGTDNQTVCLGASIQNISYTINRGNVSVYNLPPGVNYTLNGQEIIITGTPNQAGVYNYNIIDPVNGNGCIVFSTQGTITVGTSANAPTGSTSQTLCSGSTIADLAATGTNIKWYATSTGGTALASTTALVNGTTYYASQTVNGCESTSRMEVVFTLNNPTVTASATSVCGGQSTILTASSGTSTTSNFSVGSVGPSGGYVFYDQGSVINGWRYLEAAPTDNGSDSGTGCYCASIPNASNLIGTGQTNTANWINAGCTGTGGWFSLAQTIAINGLTNWFVPSKDEVNSMYTNLKRNNLGDFQNVPYWSSSPAGYGSCGINGGAWVQNFINGTQYSDARNGYQGAGNLRLVRQFATGTPFSTYSWSTGSTSAIINVTPTATTQYWVDVTTNGVTCRKYITITVNPSPSAPIIGVITQPTCSTPTGSVVLTGLPSGNWTINPGGITGSTTTATLSVLSAGAYNYTVTNASGCISSASANVIINPPVSVTPTFTSISPICSGAVLGALPLISSNGVSGTWSPALNNIATTTYTFTPNPGECATTASMTITVIPCSPNLTCGENFSDNGGVAANYANNTTAATGTTIICPNNPGNVVTVNFTSFATESGWDFLKIYDGNSPPAILLGNFSGTTIPGPFTASTASGCLTFVFTSDATLTAAGWNANVTCAPPATCTKPNTLTATAITQFTALLGWFQPANPNGSFALASQVIAVPCGSVAPTASTIGWINAPSNPFNLTGLNSASCYEFYVRSVCSPTDSSLISGPFSFNTLIANDECVGAITVPVNQNTNCLQTVVGSLSLATASPEANSCGATATLDDNDDVWFKFTATATSHYISLLGVNYTATPTGLSYAIYTGSCGSLTQFGGCRESLNGLTIGTTYYIRVYSTGTTAVTTAFEFCIGTNVGSCNSALPLCVIQPIILPNSVGVPTLPNPISPFSTTSSVVGCLGSAPSPTFFNLQIPANGNYNFFLEQNTNSAFTGTGIDVDFVAWGPFASNAAACAGITTGNAPATGISCSYSINFTENFVVNNAIAGQIYVVMVTNYNGRKGFIKITQTAGAVPTACCPFGNFAYSNTSFSKDGVNPSPVFTNNATAGVFSAVPTGLSINPTTGLINLATSSLGTYVVHNSIASSGTCPADDDTWTITITEQTSAAIYYSGSPFCNSYILGNVTLSGTGAYTGGTFSSQPNGLSINSTTGEIMLYQSAVGSYTVTYTIPASNGSSIFTTNTTVIVNPAPWAVFSYGDICGSYSTSPVIAGGGEYLGGTFSSQPDGLWINPVTGVINARTSYPGNYTVIFTIPASGGCPSIETTENITINPIPTATISGTRTVCIGDSATVIFNGTPNASVTYTVDGGAIQTIVLDNAGNATLTTSPFANCTYSLVSVSSNGTSWCTEPLTGTVTITVNPRPVNIAIAPSSQSICSGTAAYIDIYSNSIGTEFFWTADVNNVTGATSGYGNYISQTLTTTGTLPGTVTYIITPYNYNNVCAGEIISIQITVNPIPVVTASSSHQTICSGNTNNINLSSSVTGTTFSWTAVEYNVVGASSGSGNSISQTLTTLGNSEGLVTYTITPSNNGCLGVPTIATVAVNPYPTVIVPTNATYSNNAIVPASDFGSTLPGISFYWTNDNINIGLAAAGTGNIPTFIARNLTNTPITANITVTPSYYSSGCTGNPRTYSITVLPTTTIGNISITSSNNTIGLFDTVTVDVQLTNASDLYSLYMKLKGNLAVSQYLDYSGYTASTLLGSSADVIATDPIVTNGVYDFGITKIGNVSGYSGSGLFYTFRFVTKNIPIPAGTNFCFYLDEISAYNTAGTPSGLTNQGQYCYTFSNQTNVWPGDLNKSNTVTTADLLPIGYFYNSTGAIRPNATILWTAQPAVLWGYNHSSINGNGYKVFADSNGDGVINNADQAAIGRNMNQIHARLASPYPIQHTTQLSSALSNGDLMVTPDNAIVNALASQTITFSVSLNNTGGLNGLYGISVNLLFDNTIFDLSTASIDYTGSIFGTAGTDCLVINHTSTSMESVGLTRYANAAINGQGLLFKVTLQTRFPFTSPLNQTLVSSYVEAANNQNGDPLVIQDAPVTNIIITNNLGVNTIKSNEFVLYPNPANEVVNLVMGTNTTELNGLKLKVINVLGQTVEKMNIQNTSMEISTRNWGASGVFFVEITNENNSILMTKKVIVVRK